MTKIVVHHLERSRSLRVLWLLEELELAYEMKEYARNPTTMRAPPELKELHPLGKSPIVTIDGEPLAESGAILEHLVDELGEGRLKPASGADDQRRYRFYMHYAEGSMMPPLLVKPITTQVRRAKVPFFVRPIANGIAAKIDTNYTDPELDNHLRFLDGELADRAYFAGDELTAADVQMIYPMEAAASRADLGHEHPNLAGWLDRVRARPAFQRALERGGPFLPGSPS